MPIAVFQPKKAEAVRSSSEEAAIVQEVATINEPSLLFQKVDNGEITAAEHHEDLDYVAFASLLPEKNVEALLTPPGAGGGGTGGPPVGSMPFVAEDYGMAGSPDSDLAPQVLNVIPQEVAPTFILEDLPTIEQEVALDPLPLDDPLPHEDPPIGVQEVNPSSVMEDPTKDDNVSEPFEEFVYLFLMLNREPTDEQMHMLAASIGVDRRKLEECIFRMLRELLVDKQGINALSSTEYAEEANDDINLEDLDVDDEKASFTRSPILNPINEDEMMINDGQPMEATEFEEPPLGTLDGVSV